MKSWPVFAYGFRPFFLLAGLYAALAIGIWIAVYPGPAPGLAGLPAHYWHAHEMIFGFIAAAIAGFMLTAVPSWTGVRGFAGTPLVVLALLWLAGRIALLLADVLPFWLTAAAALAFLPALMVTLAPALLRKRNRNQPLLLVLLAFWIADLAYIYGAHANLLAWSATALRGALGLVLILLTVIGGRIVPAFTSNALKRRGIAAPMRSVALLEPAIVLVMIGYLVADTVAPLAPITAGIAGGAGVLHLWRMAGWQSLKTGSEPIVWVLHIGYVWLPVGLLLRAAAGLLDAGWAVHWQHALGAGAAGTMILAVMTRASLGHTGRPLVAGRMAVVAYVLLTFGVLVRVFGPALQVVDYRITLWAAASAWALAYVLFVVNYAPILTRPRADGLPG